MSTQTRFSKTQPIISGRLLRLLRRTVRKEGSYQAVSGLAVWCLIVGLLSSLTFLDWGLAAIPAVAVFLGWIAVRRIRRNPEEMSGIGIAWCGVGLAVFFWVVGYGWLIYESLHWSPPGYIPITYAMLQPAADDIEQRIPGDAVALDTQNVYIRGYIIPGKQRSGLKEFYLSQDLGDCPYCKPMPRMTQVIKVKLKPPRSIAYTTRAIGVGGKLTVVEDPKDPRRGELGGAAYLIEADYVP